MFLFHWCLNAIRCRREWTVETTPLSPTKYNGLPPSLDCELQRQLVGDIPASSYDVTFVSRSLLDDDNAAVQHPTFLQDRRTCLGEETSTAASTCHSESRDIRPAVYYRPDDLDEPTTSLLSSTLRPSADEVAVNGMNGRCGCECETADTVNENTSQLPYSFDVNNTSVPSVTEFCISSSPYSQAHIYPPIQHGGHSLDKESSPLLYNEMPRDTQSTDHIGSSSRNSLRSTGVYAPDMSHRNVSSFPVDTFQDPLVTVAMLLVNSAVKTAVRILNTDATLTSESNQVDEIVLSPISNTPNFLQPLPYSEELTSDPIKVAASKLVNQVLLDIERKSVGSAFARVETLPSETAITTAIYSAASHSSFSPSGGCESDSKLTADNDVESCVTADADSVLMPAAVEDYLSESSTTVCSSVDESEVLTEQECDVAAPNCTYNSVHGVNDDSESTKSLSSGRLAFVSEGWSSGSSPFIDAYLPDNISEVMYIDNVNVEELKVDSRMGAGDELQPYPLDIDDGTQARMLCSAETDLDLSGITNTDDATNESILYGLSDDDSFLNVHTSLKQYASQNTAAETWNSCRSNYRPEDYFFHRYVIPVDQLEASDLAAQSDREEQRTKMQLDLKADERKYASDIDADIEAVAAFCRAMFTPVESEIHDDDDDDNSLPFDIVGSPGTSDTEEQYTLGRPAGVRRCISLRTSPGTPHKKKSVRFADALGLDLEYVRQIQTGDDSLPIFATNDDTGCARRPLLAEASAAWSRSRWPVRRYLCACFQEPGSHPDFMERVLRSRVVLETCEADDRALKITGVIRVANVAYHKTVAARVTTDGWVTQTDVTAEYVPRSNDGTTDRFSFQIVLPHGATDVGRRVEFAVYFIAFFDFDSRSETYWDNNFGANYCFECYGHDDNENSTLDADNDDDPFSAWFSFT